MPSRRLSASLATVIALLGLGLPAAAHAAPASTPTPAPRISVSEPVSTGAAPTGSDFASATPTGSDSAAAAPESISPVATAATVDCDELSMLCSGGNPLRAMPSVSAEGAGARPSLAPTVDGWGYINAVAPLAVDAMNRYGVPASVSIAQSILESGWGKSGLTVQGNAFFGIKCSPNGYMSPWQNRCLGFPTQEWNGSSYYTVYAYFRGYANERASFMDHGLFLTENQRYAPAFRTSNADDFIRAVARAGYATDPNYANSVIAMMQRWGLYQFDRSANTLSSAIGERYRQLGGQSGRLGRATGPEVCGIRDGGCYQNFEGGAILWSRASGAWESWGAIRNRYAQVRYENSPLGFPTGPEVCGIKNGGCYQNYQGGAILWSERTGAWESWGAIRARYAQLRYEYSTLALPTGPEVCGIKNGGCYQNYQGGAILWSSRTGAWESLPPLRSHYAKQRYELGSLGLPAGPMAVSGATVSQRYEGGTLVFNGASFSVK